MLTQEGRIVNLTILAPEIVAAVLDETLPPDLTLFELAVDPPALREEQRRRIYQTASNRWYIGKQLRSQRTILIIGSEKVTQTIPRGEQPCGASNTSGGAPIGEPLSVCSCWPEGDWVQKYERRSDPECPIVSGDEIDHSPQMKGTVTAFRWHGNSSDPSEGLDLCELITSDGARELALAELAGCEIDRRGLRPPLRLASLSGPTAVTKATASFAESMQEFLAAPLVAFARNKLSGAEILSPVRTAGYDVFVVGGAVRDLIRNALAVSEQLITKDKDDMDLDVSGTVPFRVLDTLLARHFEAFQLRCRLSSDRTVLIVQTVADNKKPQTIVEYAPLKHSFRDDGYRFDHDMQIDVGWRDLTMNCLFFDPFTRLLLDPGQQALDDILRSRLRPVASVSYHPPGAVAIRLFRLLKFTVRPGFDRCDYSEAAAWLSTHLEDCLRDFRTLPSRDEDPFRPARRDRVLLKFYKTWDSLRDDRANNWQNLRNGCARLNEALTAAGADLEIWSAGVQEMTS